MPTRIRCQVMHDWRLRIDAGEGERFADGHMADVVWLDDHVVRSRAPWSDATHAVLQYLEEQGFPGSPRLVDSDSTHEVLSYLLGRSIPADLNGYRDDETLLTIAAAIRSLHQALKGFSPPEGVTFPRMPGAPRGGSFVCHNDLAPWNTIMDGRTFSGFVDWDLVTLATPAWDFAYATWCFVPLYADDATFGDIDERGRRLALFLDEVPRSAIEGSDFIEVIGQRQRSAFDTVEQWGRAGVPGFDRLYRERLHRGALDDIAWFDRHRGELRRAIAR